MHQNKSFKILDIYQVLTKLLLLQALRRYEDHEDGGPDVSGPPFFCRHILTIQSRGHREDDSAEEHYLKLDIMQDFAPGR
jgi:hypothetical protein